jgi:hypothetical protein
MTSAAVLTLEAEACRDLAKLREYLAHESSLVREGAVYGLAALISDARNLLGPLAIIDPSPGVREAAKEALE